MEDIGDIIYFVSIAIVAIVSLFGKGKKKNKQDQKSEEKKPILEEFPQSWEEFERMLDGSSKQQDENRTFVPKPKDEPARSTQKRYSSPSGSAETIAPLEYDPLVYESMSYESATDYNKLRVKKQIKKSIFKSDSSFCVLELDSKAEENLSANDISLANAEDARKAFLYSEIFNRKYN